MYRYRYRPKNFQNIDIGLKKSYRSSSSLDFKFRLGLTLWLIRARVTVWVKFKVGVRTRIAFFLFPRWHANKLCIFQMIWFYGLLVGNKARTGVLPLPIIRV